MLDARSFALVSAARLPAARPESEGAATWTAASPEHTRIDATALLTDGGDGRIERDEATGLNRYGCGPTPDADIAPYGSSTASTISPAAFAAAERLTGRLAEDAARAPHPVVYRQELERIRHKLTGVLGVADIAGLKTVISPSGTDLHRIALHIAAAGAAAPPLVILPEPHETGSGVVAALGGQIGPAAALRAAMAGSSLEGAMATPQIMSASSRAADGSLRPAHEIDEDISVIASAAARLGRRVLLVMMDVSKTGLISPSVACAQDLKRRFPDQVEVFVDACQLRLAPTTLAAYLGQDFMVAITGSKFMTGPAFSAALLVPAGVAARLADAPMPRALTTLCALGEWPQDMTGGQAFEERANFGLLLRWEAALEEMRRFSLLPPTAVNAFFGDFAAVIGERLAEDDVFEAVAVRPLERTGLGVAPAWDRIQTIFPFLLRAGGRLLTPVETVGVQRLLGVDLGDWAGWSTAARRIQLGQPVNCGARGDEPLVALRLCMSARLASTALSTGGRGGAAVIGEALDVMDKTAWLAKRLADA
jgi:hypothetical protein